MMARGDTFEGGFDQDGFHLSFNIDDVCARPHTIELDGTVHMRLTGNHVVELVAFLRKEGALDYAAEFERERAAYERATPEERARVLGREPDDGETGYAPDDPKHPTYHERTVDQDDITARDLAKHVLGPGA